MYHYKKNILKTWSAKIFLTGFFLLFFFSSQAQFTITDDFRNQGSPDIITGDGAYFTSGIDDPAGAGWLRLTKSTTYQKGYAYINRTFPSTLGLLIDFEYKMWRNTGNTNAGADGMSFFLFDGAVTQANFRLGGYGGSLGYARNTSANPAVNNGLLGGYIGVGLDAYGNFSNPSEGRNQGPGVRPNAIVVRGSTIENTPANSNPFLASKELGIRTGTDADVRGRDEIDYNTIVTARPADNTFYRRVQLEIIPTVDGKYRVIVRLKRSLTGAFVQEIDYVTTDVPPALLKLGFAASTGADLNFHELRNLQITTPKNLRVSKRASRDWVRTVSGTNPANQNQITYTIEVTNDTDLPYTNATFTDELLDVNGAAIPTSMFVITPGSITTTGFTSSNISQVTGQNKLTGTLSIAPNTTGYITVTGTMQANQIPASNTLINKVSVMPAGSDTDFDLGNNIAVVNTPVMAEDVDLILIKKAVGAECLDQTNGNTAELRVANMGIAAASYFRPGVDGNKIVVIKEIPTGYTYTDTQTSTTTDVTGSNTTARWTRYTENIASGYTGIGGVSFPSGGIRIIYVARFPVSTSGQTLAGQGVVYQSDYPIIYTIKPPTGVTSFVDAAKVEYRQGNTTTGAAELEIAANRTNNTHTEIKYLNPGAPTVPNTTIYYCLGETAPSLVSAASVNATGASLIWYLNPGGTAATVAPTPSTTVSGTTTYYVSQKRGNCEGSLTAIDVVVLPTPSAGVIAGDQTTCSGGATTTITSTTAGQATGWPTGTTITYRWEVSSNGSTGWTTVPNVNTATLAPGQLTATSHYRRITIATTGSKSCTSAVTNTVVKTVNTVNAGVISGDQTICTGSSFTQIGSTTPGSGSATTVTYRWESSATGAAGSWTTISGATAATYTPVNTVTTYFRRVTISTLNSIACEAASNTIVKAVNTVNAGAISGDQTICTGGSFTQISSTTAGSGAGSVTYRWESSATGAAGSWATISGATAVTYTPVNTVTTYFRRVTISTLNAVACEAASNTIVKTVNTVNAGIITGNQNICTGIAPAQITSTTPGSGAGTITYRWEISTTGTGGWSTISGATGTTYTPVNTTTMYFRRVTISTLNTIRCEAASSVITVAFKNCKMVTNPMIRQRTK